MVGLAPRKRGERALNHNQLAPWIPTTGEHVGVHQPRRIVVGSGLDGREEASSLTDAG